MQYTQYYLTQQDYQRHLYKRELRSTSTHLGVLLLIFFGAQIVFSYAAVAVMQATHTLSTYFDSQSMNLLLNGVLSSLIFFVFGVVFCLIRRQSFARLFPFGHTGGRMLAMLCVIGLTFSLMSNYAASMVTDVFSLFGVQNQGGEIIPGSAKPPILLYYLTVAVLPAFAEEFAFRGVIMGSLRKYSDALALLVSSAAFAFMHGNFVQLPFTFCCGLAFGFIALKANSLLPSIIIHFLNNALSVTYDVLTSYGVVDTKIANIGYCVIIIVCAALSLFFLRRITQKKPEMFLFEDSDEVIPFREKMKASLRSPALISFAVLMTLYSVYVLVFPSLG